MGVAVETESAVELVLIHDGEIVGDFRGGKKGGGPPEERAECLGNCDNEAFVRGCLRILRRIRQRGGAITILMASRATLTAETMSS